MTAKEQATEAYETRPYLAIRRLYTDVHRAGRRKNIIHGLVEVDVTDARHRINAHSLQGSRLSFTAFLMYCLAQSVAADRVVHAYRQGGTLMLFHDVDVNTQIETRVEGQNIVQSVLIRAAQAKSVQELTAEIDAARAATPDDERRYRGARTFALVPRFVRTLGWRVVASRPRMFKRFGGTVGLSSVGMFGNGGWAIPIAPPTLMVTVGGITAKPRFLRGELQNRELLAITLSFDHDIVDGAPAARFARHFAELVEAAAGIDSPSDLQHASADTL